MYQYQGRTSLAKTAKDIELELRAERNWRKFNFEAKREVCYNNLVFFRSVCKKMNIRSKYVKEMQEELRKGEEIQDGRSYHFSDEKLYKILLSNEDARKYCEENGYTSWQEIVEEFK